MYLSQIYKSLCSKVDLGMAINLLSAVSETKLYFSFFVLRVRHSYTNVSSSPRFKGFEACARKSIQFEFPSMNFKRKIYSPVV